MLPIFILGQFYPQTMMFPTSKSLCFGLFLFSECKCIFSLEKRKKRALKVSFALLAFKPPRWGRGRGCDSVTRRVWGGPSQYPECVTSWHPMAPL